MRFARFDSLPLPLISKPNNLYTILFLLNIMGNTKMEYEQDREFERQLAESFARGEALLEIFKYNQFVFSLSWEEAEKLNEETF